FPYTTLFRSHDAHALERRALRLAPAADRDRDAEARDQVGDGHRATAVARHVRDRSGDAALEPLVDARVLRVVGPQVSAHHAVLRVAEPDAVERGDHVEHLVDVQVAAGAVPVAQHRRDRAVPALEHVLLAWIARVEVDAAL